MKHSTILLFIVISIFTSLTSKTLFAQDTAATIPTRYFNESQIGIGIGLGSFNTDVINNYQLKVHNNELSLSIQTINGFIFNSRTGVGIGVGVDPWTDGLFFPVFGHVYYDFLPRTNTLYGAVNMGYAFGERYSTASYASGTGGFMLSLEIGYKMKIGSRLQFEYGAFYRYQSVESTYNVIVVDSVSTRSKSMGYRIPYNFAGFRLGVLFH
jgi:hypothetical protein